MPKNNIDYSNTIIYKIYCKDININDVYVGHTTNFSKRKYQHKISCKTQNVKIYNIIRENGGWENWDMIEIANYNCKNSSEARIKEQYYYKLLNATLNSINPIQNMEKLFCKECNIQFALKYDFENHKHNKNDNIETDNLNQNDEKCDDDNLLYFCKICNYNTDRKHNYERHNVSKMHFKNIKISQINKNEQSKGFQCICGNVYKYNRGLSNHKKSCDLHKPDKIISNNEITPELVLKIIEQNKELTNIILQQNTTINKLCDNTNTNITNNTQIHNPKNNIS
jgi:hypothetical protein